MADRKDSAAAAGIDVAAAALAKPDVKNPSWWIKLATMFGVAYASNRVKK